MHVPLIHISTSGTSPKRLGSTYSKNLQYGYKERDLDNKKFA